MLNESATIVSGVPAVATVVLLISAVVTATRAPDIPLKGNGVKAEPPDPDAHLIAIGLREHRRTNY